MRQCEFKKHIDGEGINMNLKKHIDGEDIDINLKKHIDGEGITDVFKSIGSKLFGKGC